MSIVHKCDKCGKEFDKDKAMKEARTRPGGYYSVVKHVEWGGDEPLDICPTCSGLLGEWFSEDPVTIGVACEQFIEQDPICERARTVFVLSCGHVFKTERGVDKDHGEELPKRCPFCESKIVKFE